MKEHKVIKNGFSWVPMDKRKDQFGLPLPPRKPETRVPILWIARQDNELYLVNSSNEILDLVSTSTGGFQTADDDVLTVSDNTGYEYKKVKHNEAVKIEEYDAYYDLDFVLQVIVKVQSEKLGCLEIFTPAKKGGIEETVLLWNTGESGKHVSIGKCKSV